MLRLGLRRAVSFDAFAGRPTTGLVVSITCDTPLGDTGNKSCNVPSALLPIRAGLFAGARDDCRFGRELGRLEAGLAWAGGLVTAASPGAGNVRAGISCYRNWGR